MRTGRWPSSTLVRTSRMAASGSLVFGTRNFLPYRDARTGSHGSIITTAVGTPPWRKLRTAPRPTASELRTTASGVLPLLRNGVIQDRLGSSGTFPVEAGDMACELASHVRRARDEAAERAKGIGRRCSKKVETRHGRLKADLERGIPVARANSLTQCRREKRIAMHVYAISGREKHVIDHTLGSIAELEADTRAIRCRRSGCDMAGGRDLNRLQPWREPAGATRPHRLRREESLQRERCMAIHARPRNQPADKAWAHDVERRARDGTERLAHDLHHPAHLHVRNHERRGTAHEHFDARAGFLQQGR